MKYEVQQDNANHFRVIRTGSDGVRRAIDNPPCTTRQEAEDFIGREEMADDSNRVEDEGEY
jgi:hypothetical protein